MRARLSRRIGPYSDVYKRQDALPAAEDIASIKRRERYTTVYLVETDGKLDTLKMCIRDSPSPAGPVPKITTS